MSTRITRSRSRANGGFDPTFNRKSDVFDKINPTYDDVKLMYESYGSTFTSMTNTQWVNDPRVIEWLANSEHAEDLTIRAHEFVKYYLINKCSMFIYMDGHGRFTYHLLKACLSYDLDIDTLTFVVVDIDCAANGFHSVFYPQNIQCEDMDIFDAFIEGYQLNACCYMNFCGLGGLETANKIQYLVLNGYSNFMLSYSLVHGCDEKYSDLRLLIESVSGHVVTDRGDFWTVWIGN